MLASIDIMLTFLSLYSHDYTFTLNDFYMQHLVFFLTGLLAWVIPDVPKHLDNQVKKEAFLAKKALISEDIVSAQSEMDML